MNIQTSANIITSGVHSLRTADAFPIVASGSCSQAMGYIDLIQIEKKEHHYLTSVFY